MPSYPSLTFRIHSIAVQTANFNKAFRFYRELLGMPVIREPYVFKGKRTLAWLDAGTCLLELYSVKTDEESVEWTDRGLGPVNLAIEVQDINLAIKWLRDHQITILREPFIPPSGDPGQPLVAFIEGPDGEEILIREPSGEGSIVP